MNTKTTTQAGERTQTKYTPGPWVAFIPDHYMSAVSIVGDGHPVAHVVPLSEYGEAKRNANAALIAAAPELLQALSHLRAAEKYYSEKALTQNQAAEECVEFILAQEQADKVLAKAEGRAL